MIDFLMISVRSLKNGVFEIYPKFIIKKSSDLMIRGGDFYAIWCEDKGLWSTDEQDAIRLIDNELRRYYDEHMKEYNGSLKVLYMWDAESGVIDAWHKYCQKQMRDNFHMLDEKLIFANSAVNKDDFASKRLNYPLEDGDIKAWDKIVGTLYSPEERCKIEWAIGAVVSGDSKKIQKFMVLYGAAGTGKSTILNIIQKLFEGYYSVFDAKALGSSSNSFALESFKTNPLVAIQHDGDLSRIEDNTRLNSLVSHELMTVNEKFKSTYSNSFKAFLFMGTNKPVRITDAKSGLIRRLIDVVPTGEKLPTREYNTLMKQIDFELGAIAYYCRDLYLSDVTRYDDYQPTAMMGASNDFYNFIIDAYLVFKKEDGTTLKAAWEMYKQYCEEAKVPYPMSQRSFKEELKNYFYEFKERTTSPEGNTRIRNYYIGFKAEQFEDSVEKPKDEIIEKPGIEFLEQESIFDKICENCPAQYASTQETPSKKWEKVKTKLMALNTKRLHYVKVPDNHIVIDFDIPGKDGKKNFELNLEAASKWPPTYAELSKSGAGIHLHYIYTGDVSKLSRIYDDHIEIKIFNGNSSLRRKLSKCNNLPIATISSGLPTKREEKMVNKDAVITERGLREMIQRNLDKQIHSATKPSIDFIYTILSEAYEKGLHYDVTDMQNAVFAFAASSTNQSDYCIKLAMKMKFKSDEPAETTCDNSELIFYDVEVFPNLLVVNWKMKGEGRSVVRMINPSSKDIAELLTYPLVGFNCRGYDNHILHARLMGYDNEQLYHLSQRIISGDKTAKFGEAYNYSYTDVYDFASAGNKMSLKKWEIKLGITHHELGLPWDKPVPEELWAKVAEYCDDDVLATEALFNHLSGDWTARQILADLAGMTVNDTTNTLTTRFIFGNEKKPQREFNWRNLAEPVHDLDEETYGFLEEACPEMMSMTHGDDGSLLPYFPGYEYNYGTSTYWGEEVGEGGYVYAEPSMYGNVALLDIASMHPHSAIAEALFGVRFTEAFRDIVEGRVSIKHEDWDVVNGMLGGKLTPYVQKVINGEMKSKDLANALKTAINSVYGLTSARFDNAFKDPRNNDNIVAKRGALFMVNLKHEVQDRGFTVAHIKTDSIKIPDATPEIISFVMDYGKQYGYTFEHEATYDRMCIVNDAVYVAKYKDPDGCKELYGYVPGDNADHGDEWTATGKQFAVPYLFKNLFSKEPIEFGDMCETFNVTTSLYLDMNEDMPDVSTMEKELEKLIKDMKKQPLVSNSQIDDIEEILQKSPPEMTDRYNRLKEDIEKGHSYQFVGRVGQFCPIKSGCGGGLLMREKDGKYYAATGSKGYRWMESEMVKNLHLEEYIDKSYYEKLINDAIESMVAYGDYNWFVSDEPYIRPNYVDGKPIYEDEMPFL